MESEQQYEWFDMECDYEGGQYLYTGKKRTRRQMKEEQLCRDKTEQSIEGRSRREKRPQKTADYTKRVSFISGGVVKCTEGKLEALESAEHPGAGLGDRNGLGSKQNGTGLGCPGLSISSGIGFRPAKDPQVLGDYDGDDGVVLPASFGRRYGLPRTL